ncbi:unnamed protein product [Ectocarpus sp. CCAP 1310/34]|nr:unnamed protein product [Ectocarpus sp. CCAP 1310/34]
MRVEVLKCIMLREGYLARVTSLAEGMQRRSKRSCGPPEALPPGMVDLLDLLRIATLETVEAISLWRLSQVTPTPAPFEWNGRNYLMKMLQDCDFLDRVEALRKWLGFPISGNPFFVPQDEVHTGNEAEERSASRRTSQTAGAGLGFDKFGLADVGRQPWLGPLVLTSADEGGGDFAREANSSRRRKQRRLRKTDATNSLAPYAAAVVNDPTLLAVVKAPCPTRRGDQNSIQGFCPRTSALELSPRTATRDVEALVPNLVSRDDACRIGVARKALMDEQKQLLEAAKVSEAEAAPCVGRRRKSRAWSRVSNASSSAGWQNFSASVTSTAGATSKRPSTFEAQVTRRTGSTVGTLRPNPQVASALPETGDMRSLVLTAAGLMNQPLPDPHPGLGPVVLKSGLPGGQLHPDPFIHTVSDARTATTDGLEQEISIVVPIISGPETEDRCSTAPSKPNSVVASSSTRGVAGGRQRRSVGRRSSVNHHRAVTAPESISTSCSLPRRSLPEQGPLNSCEIQQDTPTSRGPFAEGAVTLEMMKPSASEYSNRALGLSRKAGAELRALTAAGTTGRRQPPPREIRLRRLARDVARHAAELRRLVGEENRLRKYQASRCSDGSKPDGDSQLLHCGPRVGAGCMENDDDALARMVSVRDDGSGAPQRTGLDAMDGELPEHRQKNMQTLLEAKRREIELKTFDLGVKRHELGCLRVVQKQERERKLALEMERRRARLADGQRLPEDEKVAESLEESFCLLVQKRIRGNTGRKYASCTSYLHAAPFGHRGHSQAVMTIQRGVRFIWDRRATRRRLLLHASATPMQATIRMFVKRQAYKRLLREKKELFATGKLQRIGRGMLGRRRAAARRSMIAAATRALDWISLENLQPEHLKELAHAIHGALIDPVRQFPPAGVLGALRTTLTILDDAKQECTNSRGGGGSSDRSNCSSGGRSGSGSGGGTGRRSSGVGKGGVDMVTFQTALGRTVRTPVSSADLTWEMAARVLERPFRLLRRMRAFASGLGAFSDSSAARLLHLSSEACRLLAAYRSDPSWSTESLSAITLGGTAARALVGWAVELERVFAEQPRVENFLRDAQPAWLRKARSFQRRRRALELHAESCRKAVAVATQYREHLENRGRAFGDPVAALEVLEQQRQAAEEAVQDLERKRIAFLAKQAKAEEAAGRALKDDVEFAEREASVAARAEEMARRLGQSGSEELAALAGKTLDCGVILRELQRRLRVWERRCRQGNRPLLQEWIPPTESQRNMSRALGEVRAWKQITVVQKTRLVEDAGGRRFVKGFTGKDMEIWRSTVEGLTACGADIESGEARLEEDVGRFEQEISRVNAEIAAQQVSSAPWDNTTKETQALEQQEDADAARDERRIAMGSTLPPGMLENVSGTCGGGGVESQGSSGGSSKRRPVLLLLGLDLPASVRDEVRARLEHDAPDLFGQHVVGVDALPSLASAAQAAGGQGCFLEPCQEQTAGAVTPPPSTQPTRGTVVTGNTGQRGSPNHGERLGGVATARGDFEQDVVARTRANLVQAALSAGKNVSLEVVPGPGLWARGRFLRDLEALLGGLDACGCGVDHSDTDTKQTSAPTVLLVEGHSRNRAGGGIDVSHGTKFVDTVALRGEGTAKNWKADCSYDQGPEGTLPPASLTARRLKALMEEAGQCLHDLSTEYGRTPSPFKAIQDDSYASTSSEAPREAHQQRQGTIRAEGSTDPELPTAGSFQMGKQCNTSLAATGSRGTALLLAACHMLLHPGRRYDLGEFRAGSGREVDLTEGVTMQKIPRKAPPTSSEEIEHGFDMVHASDLARSCREELANQGSARGVAALIRRVQLDSMPLETAVALQRVVQHSDWPVVSPLSDFAGCSASGAFVGWVVAAVAVTTELVLGGGGVALGAGSGSARNPSGDEWKAVASGTGVVGRGWCGGAGGAGSTAEGSGGDALLSTSMRNVHEERTREQRLLLGMETSLIDENVAVLDDDSPWLPPPEGPERHGDVRNRRQCRASEVFDELLDTVLRPFKARGEPLSTQMGVCLGDHDRFCVTVSRAFGSIYARAVALGTGSMRKGQAVAARTKDEDLIPLLSPNWMEK